MGTHLQTRLRTRYRIKILAAKKNVSMRDLRKRLKMKKDLFSLAVSGDRKNAHKRLVDLLESL